MEGIRKLVREVLTEIVKMTNRYAAFVAAKKHAGTPGLYLHFSNVYKLGINPKKSHADPHAIYFYPAEWIANEDNWSSFQYAVTMEYFFLCQVDTSNFLNISTLNGTKANSLMKNAGLYDLWSKYGSDFDKKPARRFWEFLDMLNVSPSKRDNESHRELPHVTWNTFWKTTRYDGFMDTQGIVNTGEPSQIGVFNQSTINIIESGENNQVSSSYNDFYKEVIDTYNIDVKKQGYINNGKEYRIYGTSQGKGIDIRVLPEDKQVYVYYSDDKGRVYKDMSEMSFEDDRAYDSSMYTIKRSIGAAQSPDVNFEAIGRIKKDANIIFNNVKDWEFKSYGGSSKSPMVYDKVSDRSYRDSMFRGTIKQDEEGRLILDIDFSLDKKMVTGDPLDVFMKVVDENPKAGDEFYEKELKKYGIQYKPEIKYIEEREIEAPHFQKSFYIESPEGVVKQVQAEFEKFIAAQDWAPPKKSKLKSVSMPYGERARRMFYEYINIG